MAEICKEDELSEMLDGTLTLESPPSTPPQVNDYDGGGGGEDEEEDDNEDDEEEEFEFSFFGGDLSSPVSAEEVFKDGQFRIVSSFSGEDGEASSTAAYDLKVKKVFIVKNEEEAEVALTEENSGAYCVWKSPVPEMSQKSNSTGFSKLWKVRDLLARSNSDGKDAFVFLTGKSDETTWLRRKKKEKKVVIDTAANGGERKEEKKKEKKDKRKKKSAFEELYGGGGDKKKSGGKSYLPYRQDLVGFFTSGSSLSRNVHPY